MYDDKPEVDKKVIVCTEKLIKKASYAYRMDDTKLTAPNLTAYSKLLDSYRGIIDRAGEDEDKATAKPKKQGKKQGKKQA